MAVTALTRIRELGEKYRWELGDRTADYLARPGGFPPASAQRCLQLLQAVLKIRVAGYHAATGSTGWLDAGRLLGRSEIHNAEANGYCNESVAARLHREIQQVFTAEKLLGHIVLTWAAAERARQSKLAA